MRKSTLAIALFAIVLATSVQGQIMITQVSPGIDGNFLGPNDINIVFTVIDTNTDGNYAAPGLGGAGGIAGTTYILDIEYLTAAQLAAGTDGVDIIKDINLGTQSQSTGFCDSNINVSAVTCQVKWGSTGHIKSITDGNYYIDINVASVFGMIADLNVTDVNTTGDLNMDSNYSFYIDNTPGKCSLEVKRGDEYKWVIVDENPAELVGSVTTVYYSEVSKGKTATFSKTKSGTLKSGFTENFERGNYDYQCYVTDSAGNSGAKSKVYTVQYPPQGASVTVSTSGGGAAAASVAGALQSIIPEDFSTIGSDPIGFAAANPIFVAIAAVAIYMLLFSKTKKRKKRR